MNCFVLVGYRGEYEDKTSRVIATSQDRSLLDGRIEKEKQVWEAYQNTGNLIEKALTDFEAANPFPAYIKPIWHGLPGTIEIRTTVDAKNRVIEQTNHENFRHRQAVLTEQRNIILDKLSDEGHDVSRFRGHFHIDREEETFDIEEAPFLS